MRSVYIIFAAILFLTASCEENKDRPSEEFEGTWFIKKILSDPGNGSAQYTNVTDTSSITFNAQGAVSSNSSYFGLGMMDSYEILDSAKIKFSFKPHSSQSATIYRYKFAGDTLILNPPCIEGCGMKLVRPNW